MVIDTIKGSLSPVFQPPLIASLSLVFAASCFAREPWEVAYTAFAKEALARHGANQTISFAVEGEETAFTVRRSCQTIDFSPDAVTMEAQAIRDGLNGREISSGPWDLCVNVVNLCSDANTCDTAVAYEAALSFMTDGLGDVAKQPVSAGPLINGFGEEVANGTWISTPNDPPFDQVTVLAAFASHFHFQIDTISPANQ